MIRENDTIKASEGKVLRTPLGIVDEVTLGVTKLIVDGNIEEVEVSLDTIKEVTPVRIGDQLVYIEATNYANAVSELIRFKYSLDDELALVANSRIGDNSREEEF